MVATQSFSISRRTLDVEDYIDIIRRHVGWIVGPAYFGLVVSICVALMMRNQYTSTAMMEIEPAQISDAMIQTTISNSLSERIQQMQTEVESRTELSNIIQDPHLDLYKEARQTEPLVDVIEGMRQAIRIDTVELPGKRASGFHITFTYYDRYKAQQVVNALVGKFEELNQNTQKTDQDAVTGFVGDLLNNAKAALQQANEKLTAFQEANVGKLPEQVQLNIARENGYSEKIRSASEQIYRDQQALTQLETQKDIAKGKIDEYDEQQAQLESLVPPAGSPAAQQNQDLAALDKTIEDLKFNLQQMHRQYSDKYPPLITAQKQLDGYNVRREELAKKVQAKAAADAEQAAADAASPGKTAKTLAGIKEQEMRHAVDDQLKQYAVQEKLYNEDIAKLRAEEDSDRKESDEVNRMLKDSTGLQAQYEELRQNQATAQATELDLEKKQQLADENSQLIQRRAGEVLNVMDPPLVPSGPTEPHRFQIVGAGFAMSMILGLGMAGFQEARDTSLKNLKDVRAYTNLPVLCSIPLLENTMLVRRKRRMTYLAWSAAILMGIAAVGGMTIYYLTITKAS